MFKKYIHLRGELNHIVDVSSHGGVSFGKGELKISPNKVPCVDLHPSTAIRKLKKGKFSVCSYHGQHLTLLDCDVYEHHLYPGLIVQHKNHNGQFKKISILIQGLSEWMDNSEYAKRNGNKITKGINTDKFSVTVKDPDKGNMKIFNENWWESKTTDENCYQFNQYALVTIQLEKGFFTTKELILKAHQIRNLFSLLLGYPLGIDYVFDATQKPVKAVYFANNQDEKKPFRIARECLVPARYLFDGKRWEMALKNVFENKHENFRDLWFRLAGMDGFSRFWEYKILACVAFVDRYVSSFADQYDEKLDKIEFRNLRSDLENAVKNYVNGIEGTRDNVLKSISEQIVGLKNSRFSSFQSRLDFTLGNMGGSIKKVVNLTPNDFRHLKHLRNKIAHGDIPKTRFDENITHEHALKRKLTILLFYWAFLDLGVSEKDFISFLENWMHPIIREAELDRTEIDLVVGGYLYFDLNKKDFEQAKKDYFLGTVLEYKREQKRKKYVYRRDLTENLKDWYKGKHFQRNIEEFLASLTNPDEVKSVTYNGDAYVQNGTEKYKVHSVCILNAPDELVNNKCNRTYDNRGIADKLTKARIPK